MDLAIVVIFLIVWAVKGIYNALKPRSTTILTLEQHDQLLREMTGKSPKECRKLIDKYYK